MRIEKYLNGNSKTGGLSNDATILRTKFNS